MSAIIDQVVDEQLRLARFLNTKDAMAWYTILSRGKEDEGTFSGLSHDDKLQSVEQGRYMAQVTAHNVLNAPTFYVDESMSKLITHAATELESEPIYEDDLPTQLGYVRFAMPVGSLEAHSGHDPHGEAHPVPVGGLLFVNGGGDDGNQVSGVTVQTFRTPNNLPHPSPVTMPDYWEWKRPWDETDDKEQKHKPGEYNPTVYEHFGQSRRLLLAFARIASSRITEQTLHRKTRKRAVRAGRSATEVDRVRVVHLPKRATIVNDDGEHVEVEWSHRWIVSGHWRRQWYPSIQGHKRIWVNPYVKGPEDKPLVEKHQAYVLQAQGGER